MRSKTRKRKSSTKRGGLCAALFLELASLVGILAIAQPAWFASLLEQHLEGPLAESTAELPAAEKWDVHVVPSSRSVTSPSAARLERENSSSPVVWQHTSAEQQIAPTPTPRTNTTAQSPPRPSETTFPSMVPPRSTPAGPLGQVGMVDSAIPRRRAAESPEATLPFGWVLHPSRLSSRPHFPASNY